MSGQNETRSRAKPSRRRLVLAVCAALAGCMVVIAWPLAAAVGPRSHWLLQALTSRLFLSCAAVLVVCAVLLSVIVATLWHAGRPYRTAGRGEQGVAILEFAMALPFLLLLSLLMAQASLLMVGNVCVHYSAFCAARTAIIRIPQDYGASEPRNLILDGDGDDDTTKKYSVKLSAITAVLPVSCGSEDIMPAGAGGDAYVNGVTRFLSLQGLEQPRWADARLSRKLAYAADHTEVAIDPPIARPGDDDDGSFEDNENVRVTVNHTFYLSVPTAARIFGLLPGGVDLEFGSGEYGTVITASYAMPNEGVQDYVDVETFPQDAR